MPHTTHRIGFGSFRKTKHTIRKPFGVRLQAEQLEGREVPATFTVTTTADTGAGSLRQAIIDANTLAGPDDIAFNLGAGAKTIAVNGQMAITSELIINGPGASVLTLSNAITTASTTSRIFNLTAAATVPVTIRGMTISDGTTTSDGGAIASSSNLTLDSVVLTNNKSTTNGGAIRVNTGGFLRTINSTISGNTSTGGNGGAVYFYFNGSLLSENTTFSGNTSGGTGIGGGAIYFYGTASAAPPVGYTASTLVVRNSTFANNNATKSGGGIVLVAFTGNLLVQNSTISGNSSADTGANLGGGGIARNSGTGSITIESSVVAGNTNANGPDILSTGVVNVNFSAVGKAAGFTLTGANNVPFDAPLLLGPLASNGGITQTFLPGATSPLLDAGKNNAALGTDQRGVGFYRTFGTGTDIGSVEVQPPGLPFGSATGATVSVPGGTIYTFTVSYTDDTGINASSIINNDNAIVVTGPAAFTQNAKFVSIDNNTNGTPRVVTYSIVPPGGSWDQNDNGTYTISTKSNQIGDISGNFIPAVTVGSFVVAIPLVLTVLNANDTGVGSLRDALTIANAASTIDTINFDPAFFSTPRTITLATELPISDSVTINGPGVNNLTISGQGAVRVFNFSNTGKDFIVSGLKATNGKSTGVGGAITIAGVSTLRLSGVEISNSAATGVGGAINVGSQSLIQVFNSTISGNTGTSGAGIYFFSGGNLTVENSTISGNTSSATTATTGGGAVYFFGTASATSLPGFTPSTVVVRNSTISGNTTGGSGGGIVLTSFTGTLLVQNSTFTGNNSTFATTTGGGGAIARASGTGTITVESSILSGNTNVNSPEIFSTGIVNVNFSAVDNTAGFTLTGANNLTTANSTVAALGLGALANNGGPTRTHAISTTSTAKDAGSNPAALTTDGRGVPFTRVFGTSADIGAFEFQPPAVSINQGAGQADPTKNSPIVFTVAFSEPVTGFDLNDIILSGTAGATTKVVSGSGANYSVSVSGMAGSGTVIANIPANAAIGTISGLGNQVSTSTDNSVTFDVTPPTVVLASVAPNPTNNSIPVTVTFSEPVVGFAANKLTFVNGTAANFAGSGSNYTFDLVPIGQGTSSVTIAAAAVTDIATNPNIVSNTISRVFDSIAPTVTINQSVGQPDPTTIVGPVSFTVVFSEAVTGFDKTDVVISGTANGNTATVSGSGTTYTVLISGMNAQGTVIANIVANAATDAAGNKSIVSTSTDNTITYNPPFPQVTINQAGSQSDPTNVGPIIFTVVFDQAVNGFDSSDIVISGTAGATTAVVSGTGPTYTVTVTGMTVSGTVIASIPGNAATGVATSLPSSPSISADNTITYDIVAPGVTLASTSKANTNVTPIPVTVTLTEPVVGFDASDLVTTNGTISGFAGSGVNYTFNLIPSSQGTVTVTIPAATFTDPAGNPNTASNMISRFFDNISPVSTIVLASGFANPTNLNPILFNLNWTETVSGFDKADITLGGTAGAKSFTFAGSGAAYTLSVTGMTQPGTVTITIRDKAAQDTTGNLSALTGPVSFGFDDVAPSVTLGIGSGQTVPTNTGPVKFLLTFSEPVIGFDNSKLSLSKSTVGGPLSLVVNPLSTTNFEVVVSGMNGSGNVVLTGSAGLATDAATNASLTPIILSNTIAFDNVLPTVTITPIAGQPNPTFANPMKYDIVFSKPVTGFTVSDLVFGGSAIPTTITLTGTGAAYVAQVSGLSRRGTVDVSVPAAVAVDAIGNANAAGAAATQTYSPTGGGVPVGKEVELTAIGADAGGGPHVRVFNADGSERFSFFAYAPTFTGGVRVATGDANGDGTEDIITAAGPGGGPHVKVFDGVTGKELWGFFAYAPTFTGGVNISTIDLNGDGIIEILTGAGAGGGPHVQVVDMFTGTVSRSFFAFEPSFTGGVNVSSGDINGDLVPDIITGPGIGGGPVVRAFDGVTNKVITNFVANIIGGSSNSGLTVAAGNFLGDSRAEIAVAPAGGSGGVMVYDLNGNLLKTIDRRADLAGGNGLRVAAGTLQGNGYSTLIVAPGAGVSTKILRYGNADLSFLDEKTAYGAGFLGGVFVS